MCVTPLLAQDYVVIHVRGEIIRQQTNTPLKRGDKINGDEQIRFNSPEAVAAVLSSNRGRFILKSVDDKKEDSDLFYIFKSAVKPMRGRMSTRAGGINNALDFQKFFAEKLAFIGEELRIKVSKSTFPQNEGNFFYIRYTYSDEQINKKLTSRSDTLIINKTELLKVDGQRISEEEASDYILFYYDAANQNSQQISILDFAMISIADLKSILSAMKESDISVDPDEVALMVTELYGRCQQSNLVEALGALNK